jgi:shikimate kinase
MKIFLIGLMGCGKTTIGLQLADELKYEFIDTDECIIDQEKTDINTIFKQKGEPYFRQLEKHCIQSIASENCVIATGGGLPCYNNTIKNMLDLGLVFWLNVSTVTIADRLWGNELKRPLINNCIDKNDLIAKLNYVMSKRKEIYSMANHTITSNNIAVSDVVSLIKVV